MKKICKELSEYNYEGIVVYSGFNEPLLNKNALRILQEQESIYPRQKLRLLPMEMSLI